MIKQKIIIFIANKLFKNDKKTDKMPHKVCGSKNSTSHDTDMDHGSTCQ